MSTITNVIAISPQINCPNSNDMIISAESCYIKQLKEDVWVKDIPEGKSKIGNPCEKGVNFTKNIYKVYIKAKGIKKETDDRFPST
ncbi:hypothetical protein [Alkalihalobacillus sp. TS-13]|uniref:hypothetical protein n=1 Tax=Alkalihalobacillus sp. TS-13 TaxID=2842455 RepID=UPI001C86A7C9|nr:hypothetical protein [Alkalihalobacillus sp. TS-13]